MHILVTGGAGFIGSHVVDALVAHGHNVRVYDSLDTQVHGEPSQSWPSYVNPGAEYVAGDIRDSERLASALDGVEAVIHYAAAVGVGQSMYKIVHYMDVNTVGTAHLLELLIERRDRIRKLIVASSMSIYGEGKYVCPNCGPGNPQGSTLIPSLRSEEQLAARRWEIECPVCSAECQPVPTDETKPLQPNSPYAIGKRDQEELCLSIGRAYRIPTVALRFFNVYGPRQALSNPYTGATAIFISRVLNGNPPTVYEDGGQTRDFVSVYDVARATLLALESPAGDYEALNLGSGQGTTIAGLAEMICRRVNPDVTPKIVGGYRAGDIRHCYAEVERIRQVFGFQPAVALELGLEELIDWSRSQQATDRFETASEELNRRGLIR